MKNKIQSFLFICSGLLTCSAQAWGPIAHRSVAVIAQAGLNQNAKLEVARILGAQSMSDVANWADAVRGAGVQYRQTAWYHFEKIEDGSNYIDHLNSMTVPDRQKGGVVAAIEVAIAYLRSPNTPSQDRLDALKFLIHFVGDIHQPLHTGRPEDMSGNKTPVNWFGYPTNLHSVWDSGIIVVGHKDILPQGIAEDQASLIYARYLVTHFQNIPISMGIDIEKWLNESIYFRPYAYQPTVQTDQASYLKMNLPIVDLRVYQAGLRLAYVLNQIYSVGTMEASETDLWGRSQIVLGSLFNIISFKP